MSTPSLNHPTSCRSTAAPASASGADLGRADTGAELDLRGVLLHPAWLGGLALLAVNDHLLKGSGLLPGMITGKLSDFAGLFVAPALFAFVIRANHRSAWLAGHFAVGLVFAALQLSPGFAALWSSVFASVGLGWTTTMDPTDLVALAALVGSYRFWTPLAMAGAQAQARLATSLARPWRRAAVLTSAAGGLSVSVATSPPPEIGEFYSDFSAQTFVHNASDTSLGILLRPLREEVQIDCGEVALDPGGLLPDSAFATAARWELPPRTSINVWTEWTERECYAVWVSGDTFAPFIMFWDSSLPSRLIPGQSSSPEDLLGAGVAVLSDADGTVTEIRDTSVELAFVPRAAQTQVGESCELAEASERLDWVGVDAGQFDVTAVDFGVDGCLRLSLDHTLNGSSSQGYICMPYEAFPFRNGDRVQVSQDGHQLTIFDAGLDASETRWLNLMRGAGDAQLDSPYFALATRELQSCGFSVDLDCVNSERLAELLVVGELDSATLSVGETATVLNMPDGRVAQLRLAHASSRALLDNECASGSDLLGADVDLVTLIQSEL